MIANRMHDVFDQCLAVVVDQSYDELLFIEWTRAGPGVSNTGVVQRDTQKVVLISPEDKRVGFEDYGNALCGRQLHVVIPCTHSDDTACRHMTVLTLNSGGGVRRVFPFLIGVVDGCIFVRQLKLVAGLTGFRTL